MSPFLLAVPLFISGPAVLKPQPDEPEFTAEEAEERLAAGWRRQDFLWIPPDEVQHIEAGQWKCGDAWVSAAEADSYHADLEHMWRIPGEHTRVFTTLPRATAERALAEAEAAWTDLVRLFGVAPERAPLVAVLASRKQFEEFTGGDMERRIAGKSMFGFHRSYGAYFADNWFDESGTMMGAGVAYWDPGSEVDASFGPLWIRHALGQSFVEGLDPSPEALERAAGKPIGFEFVMSFWEEKELPGWIRFGASSYAERYFIDPREEAQEDPLWARKWSIQNLVSRGGVPDVDKILKGQPGFDPEETKKWMNAAGLVVAFVLDGENKTVTKAHEKFVKAVAAFRKDPKKGRKSLGKAIDGLEKALEKNEKKFKAFTES